MTYQGLLIYAAMLAYLGTFIAVVFRLKRPGKWLYLAGFVLATVAFVYRWQHVRHVPLQNLFEVFICLGMLSYPISVFCRRFLGAEGIAADALIGFVVLFPAGFVFNAAPQKLPPVLQSWLFVPHVAAYMLAYMFLFKASLLALEQLVRKAEPNDDRSSTLERVTYRTICLGWPLLTLGLVLGAWWGKVAWADYWNWDPKELWSLATWLVYLGYLHFRYMFGTRHPRVNSTLAVCGAMFVVLTLLPANLASDIFEGLHSYGT